MGGAGDDVFVYRMIDDSPVADADDTNTAHIDESMVRGTDWVDANGDDAIDTDTDGEYTAGESPGDMMVNGGSGMDTIDASGAPSAVTVDLNVKVVTNTPAGDNTGTNDVTESVNAEYAAAYTSIEKVIGSANGDTLTGNAEGPHVPDGRRRQRLVDGRRQERHVGGRRRERQFDGRRRR